MLYIAAISPFHYTNASTIHHRYCWHISPMESSRRLLPGWIWNFVLWLSWERFPLASSLMRLCILKDRDSERIWGAVALVWVRWRHETSPMRARESVARTRQVWRPRRSHASLSFNWARAPLVSGGEGNGGFTIHTMGIPWPSTHRFIHLEVFTLWIYQ